MKLVVITGCLGLIGHYVTRQCLSMGYKVYGIDKLTYAANYQFINELEQHKGFTFKKADIATLEYLPDCDYVINIAAESHVGNSIVSKPYTSLCHKNNKGFIGNGFFHSDGICRIICCIASSV